MIDRSDPETGTVKTIRNRAGEVVGYQAMLPRRLSRAPEGVKNPETYQEPFGERQATYAEARGMLDAALPLLRANPLMGRGPTLGDYVVQEIQARFQEARRKYDTAARANKHVSTWRSIQRRWLVDAPFIRRSPQSISTQDLQRWFDWLRDEAEGDSGEPLSASFIRNVAVLLKASFGRVLGLERSPIAGLKLPPKSDPKVPFMALDAQRVFFGADAIKIPYHDRVMVGCGMGAALRVGELLAIEPGDVHLDGATPHLLVQYGGAGRAPTKSRRVRRVELFEPGLGFWRIWMANFYRPGDQLVFQGERGGYQKAWPEGFPEWAAAVGLPRLSSHIMRHTYAVSMLSGTWGYDPKSLDFVSQQLGHGDRQTTERHYGAFEAGVWTREVQRMTGAVPAVSRGPVTAIELLMGGGAASGSSNSAANSGSGDKPRHSPHHVAQPNQAGFSQQPEASPQTRGRARAAAETCVALLEEIATGHLRADARSIEALKVAAEFGFAAAGAGEEARRHG